MKNKSFWDINQQPFKELLTFVDFADDKLNIAFAEINFAQDRDLIIKKLIEHPNCKDIQFEILDLSDPNLRFARDELIATLNNIKIAPDKKLILLIIGLEKSIGVLDEYPEILVNLNYIRDDLSKTVSHPMLIFLPSYALTRLAKYAPDFWAWGRKVFYFKAVDSGFAQTIDTIVFSRKTISNLELSGKKERIDLLLRLLSEYKHSKTKNSAKLINIYNELGIVFRSLGDYQQAENYDRQSLTIAQQIGDYHGQINAFIGLGNIYDSLGKYQQALSYYDRSLKISQQIGDLNGVVNSLGNLGNTYNSLGKYQQTIDYCQQSLKISQQIGDLNGVVNSLGNLGIALYYRGEYQQAINCYQNSLTIAQEVGDRYAEANSLNNLGSVYSSIKECLKAISYSQQSFEIAQEIGDRRLEVASLGSIGISYYRIGEYQQAINCYTQSSEIAHQINDPRLEANALFNLGNALRKLGQKSVARQAFENAENLFQKMKLPQYIEYCDRAIQELENEGK